MNLSMVYHSQVGLPKVVKPATPLPITQLADIDPLPSVDVPVRDSGTYVSLLCVAVVYLILRQLRLPLNS